MLHRPHPAVAIARDDVRAGRFAAAFDRLSAVEPHIAHDGEALLLLALSAEALQRPSLAQAFAQRSLAIREHPLSLQVLARLARREGRTGDALTHCDRAIRLQPGDRAARLLKVGVLEEAGRIPEARAALDLVLSECRRLPDGLPVGVRLEHAKILIHEKAYDRAVGELDSALQLAREPNELRRTMLYLRAKACDRAGRYDDAFASAHEANAIGEIAFSPEVYAEQVTALIENWSKERFRDYPRSTMMSPTPVFVAGMPRSGTTLIDQIIDAHPEAAGVGELSIIEQFAQRLAAAFDPDLPAALSFGEFADPARLTLVANDYLAAITTHDAARAQQATRIVNKALGNNRLVGLLALLFPATRVVHAVRDPRDVAISCFMGGFNNSLYPWTTRLEWTAAAWTQSMRLMRHWHDVVDVPILELRYEELVTSPDTQFARLIEFLGLEWNDACRAFHASTRTVRTLSYDQVNRPLYTSSIERWRRYERHLAPVQWPESER